MALNQNVIGTTADQGAENDYGGLLVDIKIIYW